MSRMVLLALNGWKMRGKKKKPHTHKQKHNFKNWINRTYSFLFLPCYIFLPLTRQKPHRFTSPLIGKLQSNQTTSNATDWVIKTSLFLKPSSAKTFPQVFLPVKRNSITKTSNYSSPHTFNLIEVGFICNFLAESLSASQHYLYDQ